MNKLEPKKYTPEYKQEALEISKRIGTTETSKKLGIPLSTLQLWKSQKNIPVEKSPCKKTQDVLKLQSEVKKLKKALNF